MADIEWIVMSAAERARATVMNDDNAFLGARRIVHGTHAGCWVAPARLLADPDYARWHAILSPLPRLFATPEMLFPPALPDPVSD